MKCRRSKKSLGARLRGAHSHAATRKRPVPAEPASPAIDKHPNLLRIDGPTQGAIRYAGTVIVGQDGAVTGDITATIIVIEGRVEGDLQATEALRLAATAQVTGVLESPRVAVTRGARVKGRISTQRGLAAGVDAELDERSVADLLAKT